jgi:hypothetical protein
MDDSDSVLHQQLLAYLIQSAAALSGASRALSQDPDNIAHAELDDSLDVAKVLLSKVNIMYLILLRLPRPNTVRINPARK